MVYNCYVYKDNIKYNSGNSLTMTGRTFTNIRLTTETRDRLKARGFKGEDYDAVVVRLLDATEQEKIQGHQKSIPATS